MKTQLQINNPFTEDLSTLLEEDLQLCMVPTCMCPCTWMIIHMHTLGCCCFVTLHLHVCMLECSHVFISTMLACWFCYLSLCLLVHMSTLLSIFVFCSNQATIYEGQLRLGKLRVLNIFLSCTLTPNLIQ